MIDKEQVGAEREGPPLGFLGLACAVGVSTIYYNQPLLPEMARTFHADSAMAGWVAVATQVGYAGGMLLFVPMGDIVERRGLIATMYAAVAVALLLVAMSPTMGWLIAGSVGIGLLASVTHIALPIAPDLARPEERGRAIGVVMTGLLLGILLARTFAGWVSRIHGWRWVFVLAAVINAVFAPLLWRRMPPLPPKQAMTYPAAIRSLWTLVRTQPELRESCVIGALIFASFSCFWTTLAFVLASRDGPRFVISVGVGLLASSYMALWAQERLPGGVMVHVVAIAVGVVVLDTGAQMCQVANQTRIFGLVEGARSRLNTVYMTTYFLGAAVGSAMATAAWTRWGWNGVCGLALLLLAMAAMRHARGDDGQRRESGRKRSEAAGSSAGAEEEMASA